MKRGQFIIGETTSDELKSYITTRPLITTPVRKIERISVSGRSGDIVVDEKAYENGEIVLSMFCKALNNEHKQQLKSKITHVFDTGKYQSFIPYWDVEYEYEVITVSGVSFSDNIRYGNSLPYEVTLSHKPFKKLIANKTFVLTQAGDITNPLYYHSRPYIKINGSGNITLLINNQKINFKDVIDYIEIDSEIEECYRESLGVIKNMDKNMMTRDYPILETGINEISWIGSVSKVEIEPRWRTL